MATSFPGDLEPKQKGRPRKYPWHEWQNGAIWLIESGIDFPQYAEKFLPQIYTRAKATNMRVTARLEPGSIRFQFFPDQPYSGGPA